jgi:hypothetical protein
MVVDVGIEPTRCANLALSEVYKSSLHPVLSTETFLVLPVNPRGLSGIVSLQYYTLQFLLGV